jgi:hypothetical protein
MPPRINVTKRIRKRRHFGGYSHAVQKGDAVALERAYT